VSRVEYLTSFLNTALAQAEESAGAWHRDLASAENDPKGINREEYDSIAAHEAQSSLAANALRVILAFVEDLVDDDNPLERIIAALAPAELPAVTR